MKKLLSLFLALSMALALCACGGANTESPAVGNAVPAAEEAAPAQDTAEGFTWTREGYYADEDAFIVTISEEGEDGLLLELEDGSAYHLTP